MVRKLPERPNLEHLKNEAKALLKAQQAGDVSRCQCLRLLHRFSDALDAEIVAADLTLHEAQFALALDYGHLSWEALRAEVAQEGLTAGALAAIEEIRREGYAVLPDVLDAELVSEIYSICARTLARKNRPRFGVPYEMLRRPPFNLLEVGENTKVMPIVRAILGDCPKREWVGFSIRGTAPGGGQTAIHRMQLPSLKLGPSETVRALNVAILLTDFTSENSVLEVWPKSHLISDRDLDDLRNTEARAMEMPSCVITGTPGSIVIRDGRLWQRERSNETNEARIVLSRNWMVNDD